MVVVEVVLVLLPGFHLATFAKTEKTLEGDSDDEIEEPDDARDFKGIR